MLIALSADNAIRFTVPGISLPNSINCMMFQNGPVHFAERQAYLTGSEFVLSSEGVAPPTLLRFSILHKSYTGLVQHVKLIEGLSRTDPQRRFNEALSSLSTGLPNIDHFVDCIRDIIRVSDTVAANREAAVLAHRREGGMPATDQEGAELSIGLDEVVEQEHRRKQRLRGSDDLGYLLDVLLYNLRDETPTGLDDALEDRDDKGRSEEEQVDADDEEEVVLPQDEKEGDKEPPPARNPLEVCHSKVGTLVGIGCDKLDALKQGRLELAQLIIMLAGILSALRLLRGLHGKVPWIPAGETAVPQKELRRLFNKIAEVVYDGDKSLICLDGSRVQLSRFDEFARLKGLIIWLAWDSGITLADKKPFNESAEERTERFEMNRLYVATAQLINGDAVVISEARQSIGQLTSSDMDWLEKILAVDKLFRDALVNSVDLHDGASAKAGDFGFNSLNPESGIREILPRHDNTRSLSLQNSGRPKFVFPASNIRTISFERILKAT